MTFKRLSQVGGSMLFTALSFALVEKLCFESEAEVQFAEKNLTRANEPRPAPFQLAEPLRSPASEMPRPSSPLSHAEPRRSLKQTLTPAAAQPESAIRQPATKGEAVVETEAGSADPIPESIEPAAPLAATSEPRKTAWLWLSLGAGRHHLRHNLTNGTNSNFRSLQAPSLGLRAGFELGKIGIDASYDSSPGKVSSAPNATVEGNAYHWNALRADATWRAIGDRWKIRVGAQQHTSPFLYPDSGAGRVYLRRIRINYAALGLVWMPVISDRNRLEARATYLHSLNADSLDRSEISLSRKTSGSLSLAWVHSATEHFRLAAYAQSELQSYGFSYRASPGAAPSSGNQKLSSHSLGLRFGWEY